MNRIAKATGSVAAALLLSGLFAGTASAAPNPVNPGPGTISNGPVRPTHSTCSSVKSCNDLISECESTHRHFTATAYDPNSGAPSSGKCG